MLQNCGAPRGRQIAAAASAAANFLRLSVAASRLEVFFGPVFLGLTPQAMDMPPLRGFTRPPHEDCGPGRFARLHLSRGVVTRASVPLLRGFAASSQKDGVDAATCVAASRLVHIVMPVFLGLTPQATNMPLLRGFTRPPHEDCGDPAASRLHLSRGVVTWAWVSPLRGFEGPPRTDGGHPVCRFRDARPAPKARQIFSLGREPQEAVRPTPTSPEGATDS